MAVLEVEEVFSLDDLRRLAGHPHFDSCGLSVLTVLKIRDALASQQSQQPQQPQQPQHTQPPQPPQPPQSQAQAEVEATVAQAEAMVAQAQAALQQAITAADEARAEASSVRSELEAARAAMGQAARAEASSQPQQPQQMLAAAARLRALPSLTASCTRQPRSGKHRIEIEEDAEAEARSLASLAVEQPALFRAVTGADNGKLPDLRGLCFGTDSLVGEGSNRVSDQVAQSSTVDRLDGPYSGSERSEDEQFDSSVEQVRSSDPPFSVFPLRTAALSYRWDIACRSCAARPCLA